MSRVRCDERVDVTETVRELRTVVRPITEEPKSGGHEPTDLLPLLRVTRLRRAEGSPQVIELAATSRALQRRVSRRKLE